MGIIQFLYLKIGLIIKGVSDSFDHGKIFVPWYFFLTRNPLGYGTKENNDINNLLKYTNYKKILRATIHNH